MHFPIDQAWTQNWNCQLPTTRSMFQRIKFDMWTNYEREKSLGNTCTQMSQPCTLCQIYELCASWNLARDESPWSCNLKYSHHVWRRSLALKTHTLPLFCFAQICKVQVRVTEKREAHSRFAQMCKVHIRVNREWDTNMYGKLVTTNVQNSITCTRKMRLPINTESPMPKSCRGHRINCQAFHVRINLKTPTGRHNLKSL